MSFVDFPWRYANVPRAETELRLYQNMAHGGPPAFVVVGTMDQADRQGLMAARPIFQWHAKHEDLYVGQKNAARVLLLATGDTASYRGFFRFLSERHIPFVVSENIRWLDDPSRFDLVIAPDRAPDSIGGYVRGGGRLLMAGTTPPLLPIGRVFGRRTTQGYWRIHDRSLAPIASGHQPRVHRRRVSRAHSRGAADPTLIPTAMFGPPEKVWSDKKETLTPGLVVIDDGQGRAAYIPWDIGGLYYRHSSEAHANLLADLVDHLLPKGRQVRTNAHPLVEMTLMDQPSRNRTLVHLVNGSGHHDTAYFAPIEMRDIRIELQRPIDRAHAVSLGRDLPVSSSSGGSAVTLPSLKAYEVIVVE